MGRKPLSDLKLVGVGLRLTEAEVAIVDELGRRRNLTRGQMARLMVRRVLAAEAPHGQLSPEEKR